MPLTTPQPKWVKDLLSDLRPYEDRVVNHPVFIQLSIGELPVPALQKALVNFYPLIESFPQFMQLNLAKVPDGHSSPHNETRAWLISNIRQERYHAVWWKDFALGFGVEPKAFDNGITPPAQMDSINNYLWRVCTNNTLIEGMAASNYAVEGPTGTWTKNVQEGFRFYQGLPGVEINEKTLAWINAHATYDDSHPWEALEIIKAYAVSSEAQQSVKLAAMRSLEYYALALDYVLR